ncbi:hypothetical protein GCM10011494_18390 [Novosphingobium endophyticum]|uniref:histidine kinase n=1 Tax=Novosphingobium endophyticum TaxID=1955250 RepID=A0A916X5T5_9SPHN|nr:ATP-binding protein [Novosphingobium endophyticum]GGC00144.1 hypothetical protein GCM10011494_18390 [Novosphingobium endophyticum]
MHYLANYDVTDWQGGKYGILVHVLFGALCALTGIAVRTALDVWAPTAGPFAIVYPTVLIATLYGHASAGVTAYLLSFAWAWWNVLPAAQSFTFEVPTDPARVAINALCAAIVLGLAEVFRRAVRMASHDRDVEIERRGILMAEMEHRTKNNFALVASLLSLQARDQGDPAVAAALDQAIGRIRTFAQAYDNLALIAGGDSEMPMQHYVRDVVKRISASIIPDHISVKVEAGECVLPQQVAVAIGLFLNEALTNCVKYAFPNGEQGNIRVEFTGSDQGWEVSVTDNGVGEADPKHANPSGLGQNLMRAFAQQANARYDYSVSPGGCRVALCSSMECHSPDELVDAREFSPA